MKQATKRILSLCLALAMMLGMSVTVSADGNISLTVGETKTISTASVDGAQYSWTSDNPSVTVSGSGNSATVTGVSAGSAMVYVINGDETLDAWSVTVSAVETELTAYISVTEHELSVGDNYELNVYAYGGTGSYSYQWSSTDSSVVRASGSSDTTTVAALKAGTATVSVTVTSGTKTKTVSCAFTVESKQASTTYDASASATVGSNLALNAVSSSIAAQFQRDLGENLDYGAQVRFTNTNNTYGSLRFGNGGDLVAANQSYSFLVFQDMVFQPASAGTFTTGYTITQGSLTITGSISISVTGGAQVTNVTIDQTNMTLSTYSSRYLALTVAPSNAATSVSVSWTTSNSSVATVSGSGLSATVTTGGSSGTAVITATVTDAVGTRLQATCTVTVPSSGGGGSSRNTTYNPTLSVTLGSDYYGTSTSESMAKRYRDVYGSSLNYDNAIIRFTSTGNNSIGVLRQSNGAAITSYTNYSFSDWAYNIHFEPLSAGTFSVPYTINYNGNTLSGTFTIYVRAANLTVTISPTSMNLATYSSQYLNLTVTPSNVYYTVSWSSSNSNIATVSGSGASVTVNTKGTAGTATISATVRNSSGVAVVKNCTVTVSSSATYNPSVSTTLGVPYTGTGTSTAMIQQFRTLYGVTLNNNTAKIRFSSTGNNSVAVMRLSNGTAVKANTDYTMTQYIAMYTDPLMVGTFTIPYTLTYNSKSLTGNVSVVIEANTINAGVNLNGTAAYQFNSASANGRAASSILGDTITNAVGANWSYIRFSASTNTVGVLYANANRNAVANTNINQSALGNLYFVPAQGGTYSIGFTVFNSSGGTLAVGTLTILVNAPSGSGTAYQRTMAVDLDGRKIALPAYALKDANGYETNYVKLRDLASVLNGTAAQFNVGWNGAVNIQARTSYVADGSEMTTPFSGNRAYRANTAATNINGVAANLNGIVLTDDAGGGYVYYQLRDLGQALGFNVGWSEARGIYIESSRPYAG